MYCIPVRVYIHVGQGSLYKRINNMQIDCTISHHNCITFRACSTLGLLQRNMATSYNFKQLVPGLAVIVVYINGQPACALLDSGSLADFISAKLVYQLSIKTYELVKQLPVHLAIQGSRAKISVGCDVQIEYQSICKTQYFDIIKLLHYNLILRTLFLFQHGVSLEFNPTTVVVGRSPALPLQGKNINALEFRAAEVYKDCLEQMCTYLQKYT